MLSFIGFSFLIPHGIPSKRLTQRRYSFSTSPTSSPLWPGLSVSVCCPRILASGSGSVKRNNNNNNNNNNNRRPASRRSGDRKPPRGFGFTIPSPTTQPPSTSTPTQSSSSPAPLPPPRSRNNQWVHFEEQLAARGAHVQNVEIYQEGNDADGLRGIRATKHIRRGETLISIPRQLILDSREFVNRSPVRKIWQHISGSELDQVLPQNYRLAIALCYEQLRAPSSLDPPHETDPHKSPCPSPLQFYLDILPTAEEFADEGGPFDLWTDTQLAHLQLPFLQRRAAARRARLYHIYTELVCPRWSTCVNDAEGDHDPDPDPDRQVPIPSFEQLVFANVLVTSRAYAGKEVDGPVSSMLIPMVDLANHTASEDQLNTAKGLDEQARNFVVLARKDIKKGEQVFLSYGQLTNSTLLEQFGFVLDDAHDTIYVDCGPLLATPDLLQHGDVQKILDQGFRKAPPAIHDHDRDTDYVLAVYEQYQILSPPFMAALEKLIQMAVSELASSELLAELSPNGQRPRLLLLLLLSQTFPHLQKYNSIGEQLDALLVHLLQHTVDAFPTSIQDDQRRLDELTSMPPKERHVEQVREIAAIRLRMQQKGLLGDVIENITGRVDHQS